MAEMTPMMRQYLDIKDRCPSSIVFYRLGDFYEMFFQDAVLASKELDLVLTGRDCGQEERAPMCGVPYHSAEGYIARLVAKGYKVAICEQVEDPKQAKGIVKRDIVRMITPGTVTDSALLEDGKNNYIAAVYMESNMAGICFADISTGEVFATGFMGKQGLDQHIISELSRFSPKEVLLCDKSFSNKAILSFLTDKANIEKAGQWRYLCDDYEKKLSGQFSQIEGENGQLFSVKAVPMAVCGLLSYLDETQFSNIKNLQRLSYYRQGRFMEIDVNARRNLELSESLKSREKRATLLWVLDKTQSPMGARLLRQWIEKPLLDPVQITKRLDGVAQLYADVRGLDVLRSKIAAVFDMERLISKIVYGSANGRDLFQLARGAEKLPDIKNQLALYPDTRILSQLSDLIDPLEDIKTKIFATIGDNPPFTVREGGIIRDGFSPELDALRALSSGGKDKIAEIEQQEREKTGIRTLKIGYNRIFGYYIEVTKGNVSMVPDHYTRKQTLANCERYIIEELKNYENAILGAQDKSTALEYELFTALREEIASHLLRVQKAAQAVAVADVLASFAHVAIKNNYVRPTVEEAGKIIIEGGRHPVVEQLLKDNLFIENDSHLDLGENRVAIITGPNMAGKSTYMRQVALIVIMAQIGAFVPARRAEIGVCDKIFTRVGASDDLAGGQSTFMVEMSEVATILKQATKHSLVLLDEIGRGTSTYDGMSIARAVTEHMAANLGAKTLFATHYHELTELENVIEGIKNYNIAVKKNGDNIVFLRKIVPGGADDSYGIEVAQLAGVPRGVIDRAKVILEELESGSYQAVEQKPRDSAQISLMDTTAIDIAARLRKIDVNVLTPIEAMTLLYELQKQAKE